MTIKIQLSGLLMKKPFGHQSNKWSKRYFVIKDGFLLYYPETEKREMEKRQMFNIHPKGVVPLGGCEVCTTSEAGHPYIICIKHPESGNTILMAAESDYDRDTWVEVLRKSSRITWDNAQLGDSMIQQLEAQGLQMAKEKQSYFDKLQTEAQALHDEQQKTEELERIKEELELEKRKMEELTKDLSEQYHQVKVELQETVYSMKNMDDDRQELQDAKEALQHNLQDLAEERQRTLDELTQRQNETQKLSKEKENLSEVTESLRRNLKSIEEQTRKITAEKSITEHRLQQNVDKSQQMEQEKALIVEQVQDLEACIKDLSAQKAITEAELKEEVEARLEAERRLREAEHSLARLDKAVHTEVEQTEEREAVTEEMKSDVKTLQRFFEKLAFEKKVDANSTKMIKDALHCNKSMVRRAQTMRLNKHNRTKGGHSMYKAHANGDQSDKMSLTLPHHTGTNNNEEECNNNDWAITKSMGDLGTF